MKQANDIRTENILLTQACANTFWSQHTDLSTVLNKIEKQLLQIRPRSTSREHIEREKEKYQQLANEFSSHQIQFQEILNQHSSQLLSLISNNPEESEDIQRNLNELGQEWNRIQTNLNTCQNELQQAMFESAEFNSKLERVSTWFDDTSFPTTINDNNEFERIRTFKEHLDCKYLDIVNLKQDYTDIEQHKQQRIDGRIQQDQHDMEENEKTNLVEEQLINIDSKWSQLNGKIQDQ
jgi:DNA repair exonuclease SbcCD ATPase subunit